MSRYGWLGAFIAALTPIQDDLVYIPLGLAKYSPWKFATAIFAGKFLLNEGIVCGTIVLGRPIIENVISHNNTTTTPSSIIIGIVASSAILGIILYLTVKADWSKVIGKWFPWTTFQERTDSSGYNRDDNN